MKISAKRDEFFSEIFDKVENNLIYAKAAQVLMAIKIQSTRASAGNCLLQLEVDINPRTLTTTQEVS
jgi:hypothetical protein